MGWLPQAFMRPSARAGAASTKQAQELAPVSLNRQSHGLSSSPQPVKSDDKGSLSKSSQRGHSNDTIAMAVYAIPLFREGCTVRFAYIPVRVEEDALEPGPRHEAMAAAVDSAEEEASSSTSSSASMLTAQLKACRPPSGAAAAPAPASSVVGSMQKVATQASVHAQSTWERWGRLDRGTWLRWLHDCGQTVAEDVSPEARLARGISAQANKVTVYHPDCLSQKEAHQQVTSIISARSRSELWRMVGSIALFPIGVVIDHSVLLAVPAPLGSGYSSYKAYIHYKGTRGSWRMQHLIKDYEQRSGSQKSVGKRQQAGGVDVPAKGQVKGERESQQQVSEQHDMGLGERSGYSWSSRILGSSSGSPGLATSPPHGSGPGGKPLCPLGGNLTVEEGRQGANSSSSSGGGSGGMSCSSLSQRDPGRPVPGACEVGGRDSHAILPGRRPSSSGGSVGSATGCVMEEGDPLLSEEARAQQQRGTEQAVQGLEYRLLPLLSPFVALLLDGPADVLPEAAARELCMLLPQRHRVEVAQHIAELRRRHERQQQRALPRPPAAAGRQQPGKKMQEMADIVPPRIVMPKEAPPTKVTGVEEGHVVLHTGSASHMALAGENGAFLDPLSR